VKIPFYQRFIVQLQIHWDLFPTKAMDSSWSKWAFDPDYGIVKPGDKLPHRGFMPGTIGLDQDWDSKTGLTSRVYWIHAAIRILGADIGGGIFYRPFKTTDWKTTELNL
jgi:hypothetical protein